MRIPVKVVPGASRDGISGWLGDSLKLRVTAPPEGGKANKAVIQLLSAALDVPRSSVSIVSGTSSARKIVEVPGLDKNALYAIFGVPGA